MGDIFLNGIKYAGGVSNIFDPIIYSDTERKIGVWRDNKPLYQKVVAIPNTSVINSSFTFAHGIANIDTPMIVFAFMHLPTTHYSFQIPVISNNNEGISMRIDNQYIYFSGTNSFSAKVDRTMYVIVQYTKTTDSVGSGAYTAEGVPAHHYSTNETVVGTWTNGKTLYEKTVHINALPDSTQIGQYVDYPHGISDIDEIIDYEGLIRFSNGTSLKFVRLGFNVNGFSPSASIDSYCNLANIRIMCGSDRSSASADYTIWFTKTTDT